MNPVWRIIHRGRLGNRMFQYMIATVMQRRVSDLKICGLDIPEWGIADDAEGAQLFKQHFEKTLSLTGHRLNVPTLVKAFEDNLVQCIEYDSWACRVGYYHGGPEKFRHLFLTPESLESIGIPDNKLLVNVRTAEVLRGVHPDYVPTPISLIEHVAIKTGLTPTFMGQLGDDWYCSLLRDKFRESEFIPSRGPIHDFEMIRQSKNVLIPVSTFSWLACWLSEKCINIHVPLLGMYNPLQRPDIDLVPLHDNRYTFYGFPRVQWRGEKEQLKRVKFSEVSSASILMRQYIGRFLTGARRAYHILLR